MVDDADMRTVAIDVVVDQRQFPLDRGGIEDVRAQGNLRFVHRKLFTKLDSVDLGV